MRGRHQHQVKRGRTHHRSRHQQGRIHLRRSRSLHRRGRIHLRQSRNRHRQGHTHRRRNRRRPMLTRHSRHRRTVIDVIKFSHDIRSYIQEEFYYNHNNITPHQLDRNRFYAGIKGKVGKHGSWSTYFLWQENKGGKGKAWKPTYVIGASATAKY